MDNLRVKARRSLKSVKFTGYEGDIQVIDTLSEHFKRNYVDSKSGVPVLRHMKHVGDSTPELELEPRFLGDAMKPADVLKRITSPDAAASDGPDCFLVKINITDYNVYDISADIFTAIFDAMELDPLMLRFLGKWEPGSFQHSGTGSKKCYYVNYIRIHGDCVIWSYDSDERTVRGMIIPKTFDPEPLKFSDPYTHLFLAAIVDNMHLHLDLLATEHGFTFVCCASIVDRIFVLQERGHRDVAMLEQRTGHSTWNARHPMTLQDMNDGSKRIGRAKHLLLIINRYFDCLNSARDVAFSSVTDKDTPLSAPLEAMRFLQADIEAMRQENKCLLDRAQNQMSILFNLLTREDARSNLLLAQSSLTIARATKSDSTAMKTVAILTIFFLPPTFFAAFFSMPLLDFNGEHSPQIVNDRFWIYWAFTVPCTILILCSWAVLTYWARLKGWVVAVGEVVRKRRGRLRKESLKVEMLGDETTLER